MFTTFCCCCL